MKRNLLALIMVFAMIFTFAAPVLASASPAPVQVNFDLAIDKTQVNKGEYVTATLTMSGNQTSAVYISSLSHSITYDSDYFEVETVNGDNEFVTGWSTAGTVTIERNGDVKLFNGTTTVATVTLKAKAAVNSTAIDHDNTSIGNGNNDAAQTANVTGGGNVKIVDNTANWTIDYSLSTSADEVRVGETITVSLIAAPRQVGALNVTGFSQTIEFDSDCFECSGVSYGISGSTSNTTASSVTVNYDGSAVSFGRSNVIATITLKAKNTAVAATKITHAAAAITTVNAAFTHNTAADVEIEIVDTTVEAGRYTINYDYDSAKGTVSHVAVTRNVVIFTATPKAGYSLDELDITVKQNGRVVTANVYNNGTTTYQVNLPGSINASVPVDIIVDFQGRGSAGGPTTGRSYYISTTVDETHGIAYVSNLTNGLSGNIASGTDVVIHVVPDEGYKAVVSVKKTSGSTISVYKATSSTYEFTMPESNVRINITFEENELYYGQYDIDFEYNGAYVAYFDTPFMSADYGDEVYFDMVADSGCAVDDIVIEASNGREITWYNIDDRYYFTMPRYDVYITITFRYSNEPGTGPSSGNTHEILDVSFDSRYGSATVLSDTYKHGERVDIFPEPKNGYVVDYIYVECNSNGSSVTVTKSGSTYYFRMPDDDVIINVFFEEGSSSGTTTGTYSVTLDSDINTAKGTVTLSASKANSGDYVYVTVSPKGNNVVDGVIVVNKSNNRTVSVSKMSNGNVYYFQMPSASVTVMVVFEGESGSGTTTPDDGKYKVTLTYDSKYGKAELNTTSGEKNTTVKIYYYDSDVRNVVVTNKATGETITTQKIASSKYYYFRMPAADVDVKVIFGGEIEKTYTITKGITSGGTVKLSADAAEVDKLITVTAIPDFGYTLSAVTVAKSGGTVVTAKNADGSYSFVMPAANVTVSAIFTKELVHVCPMVFTDVDTTLWYHEAIDYVVKNGIMNGMEDGTVFGPNVTTSRSMIVTVLWRLAGSPKVNTYIPYTDVPENDWYSDAVRWAYSKGMLQHTADGTTFGPSLTLTREQFAYMLYTFEAQTKGVNPGELGTHQLNFKDLNLLSSWANNAIVWCNMKGIINGDNLGNLNPKGEVLRSTLAQMIMNYQKMD